MEDNIISIIEIFDSMQIEPFRELKGPDYINYNNNNINDLKYILQYDSELTPDEASNIECLVNILNNIDMNQYNKKMNELNAIIA